MATMRNPSSAYGGAGLSRFLIGYLLMLLGTLMLVHVLQPQREDGSPMRQRLQRDEPAPSRQVMLTPAAGPAAAMPSQAPAQQAPAQ